MKILLIAGHGQGDPGACSMGYQEATITREIVKLLEDKLKPYADVTVFDTNKNMYKYLKSNNFNFKAFDYVFEVHLNAGVKDTKGNKKTTGVEMLVHKSEKGTSVENNILKNIKALGFKNRGVKKRSDLLNMNTCKGKQGVSYALLETFFIDDRDDIILYYSKKDEIIDAIANGIIKGFKLNKKVTKVEVPKFKYYVEGITHVVEIDPRRIWAIETQCATTKVPENFTNFVNSIFFMPQANGIMHPQGIMVNDEGVIANNATHGKPVATLIVYDDCSVEMKYVDDITKIKNVRFAVSGYSVYPEITASKEGFVGKFTDVLRSANRPIIGYRKKDNKIVIAVRALSTAVRAQKTAKNLGLDFAISLDGGGSTTLRVDGKYKFKGDGRKIFGGITWA